MLHPDIQCVRTDIVHVTHRLQWARVNARAFYKAKQFKDWSKEMGKAKRYKKALTYLSRLLHAMLYARRMTKVKPMHKVPANPQPNCSDIELKTNLNEYIAKLGEFRLS